MEKSGSRLRDSDGRFCGGRINLESVPRLPASAVRFALEDPRPTPYLFVWVNADGGIVEALRVAREGPEEILPGQEWVSIRPANRAGQVVVALRVHRLPLPRNGGKAMFVECPACHSVRRHLYARSRVGRSRIRELWRCRPCSGLRYSSEGVYVDSFARFVGLRSPFVDGPWDPEVFSSPSRASGRFESLCVHGPKRVLPSIGAARESL